jgi:hypothetical protein
MLPAPTLPLAGQAELGQNMVCGGFTGLHSWLTWSVKPDCASGPPFVQVPPPPRFSGVLPGAVPYWKKPKAFTNSTLSSQMPTMCNHSSIAPSGYLHSSHWISSVQTNREYIFPPHPSGPGVIPKCVTSMPKGLQFRSSPGFDCSRVTAGGHFPVRGCLSADVRVLGSSTTKVAVPLPLL